MPLAGEVMAKLSPATRLDTTVRCATAVAVAPFVPVTVSV